VRPDAKLGVPKPFGAIEVGQRFPGWLKRPAGDGQRGGAVGGGGLRERLAGGEKAGNYCSVRSIGYTFGAKKGTNQASIMLNRG
jgi:hypothetical protein